MNALFNFDAWIGWIRSLDTAWLFLLILALVVAVFVVWSSSLRPDDSRKPEDNESRT